MPILPTVLFFTLPDTLASISPSTLRLRHLPYIFLQITQGWCFNVSIKKTTGQALIPTPSHHII